MLAKVEVLADLEEQVHDLMVVHEAKRILWFPSELLAPPPDTDPDHHIAELRERTRGISTPLRVALALNLLTEEGLPHFHRLLAVYLGSDSFWSKWTNLWTAEEDRHGAVLHDYTRDSQLLNNPELERMQFEYLKAGFEPAWDKDPYRVFVYTTLQERATQVSHANTGKLASRVRADDRRRALERREGRGAALRVLSADLQGGAQARSESRARLGRRDHAVDRHAGREHAELPRDGGRHSPRRDLWPAGLSADRRGADQELGDRGARGARRDRSPGAGEDHGHSARLERISDAMETRSKAKTFSFVVAFAREFAME